MLLFSGWTLSILLSILLSAKEAAPVLNQSALILAEVIFIFPTLAYIAYHKIFWKTLFKYSPVSIELMAGVFLFAIGSAVLFDAFDRLIFRLFEIPDAYWEMLEMYKWNDTQSFVLIFLAIVIVGPIIEEFLFRGMLLQSLIKHHKNYWQAIIASSLLFAFIHTLPWVFIQVFVYSILLSLLTIGLNSIFPAILLHSVHNLIQLLITNAEPQSLGWYESAGLLRISIILGGSAILYPGLKIILKHIKISSLETPMDSR